jgi:drug/metabolite transporter (DMT)-like permease
MKKTMTQKSNLSRFLPITLLVSLGITWSLGYAIARYCITHGVNPLGYSFWQSLGPALALLMIMVWTKTPFSCSKKHLLYYIFCAILGIALPNSIMYFSAGHLPSGLLAVIVNTVPILTYPIALMAKQERFYLKRILIVLLGCVGIFWLILQNTDLGYHGLTLDFSTLFSGGTGWALLTLLTPLSFACCSVFIASHQPIPSNPLSLSFGMLLFSSLCLIPFVLGTHSFYFFHLKPHLTDVLIWVEIALSSLGYLLFFALLRLAGPVYYSMVGGVVAIAGIVWGKIFFHENFISSAYVPILFILISILLLRKTTSDQ